MDKTPKPNHEILLAELELHKTEYSSLRDEMTRLNQSEEQYLNFNLAALAAVFATASYVIDQRAVSLFLIFALIFHVFLWEMLAAARDIERVSLYLVERLIPRVNAILTQLGQTSTNVFGWEVQERLQAVTASRWIGYALIPNRRWLPVLSSAGLIIAYIVLAQNFGVAITLGDVALIVLNLIVLIFSGINSLMIAVGATRKTRKIQKAQP